MYAGLDVGGTHTDAVLVDAATGRLLVAVKEPTRQDDLLGSILAALRRLAASSLPGGTPGDPARIRRLTVSTTLGLNALLSGNTDPVGMLIVPGPGLDPRSFWGDDPLLYLLPGALDHRGRVSARPPKNAVAEAARAAVVAGAKALGVVCKFGPKHPEFEAELAEEARSAVPFPLPVLPGAQTGSSLNFPRRLHTVWCNAALASRTREFTAALQQAVAALGLRCPLSVLKADAGSFSAEQAAVDPAGTMGSGPAAGLLGTWALLAADKNPAACDTLMIDMGGTTTDLALLAGGRPLLAPDGLRVAGRPTLVRALQTLSLPLGGDSCLRFSQDGTLLVGPDRLGPALALDEDARDANRLPNRPPTLTDALNVLDLAAVGDHEMSRRALDRMAQSGQCPETFRNNAPALARAFTDAALHSLRKGADTLLARVNSRPVYTIRELLVQEPLRPRQAVFVGGPAPALSAEAEQALGIPVRVPEQSACANALGAALARPTLAAELHADTLLGRMSIPSLGTGRSIGKSYSIADAEADLAAAMRDAAGADAPVSPVQTVYAERFALFEDNGARGHVLRVKAQFPAGLITVSDGPADRSAHNKENDRG